MIKTDILNSHLTPAQVMDKVEALGNDIEYFVSKKEDRIILKKELKYDNGLNSMIQEFNFLPKVKSGNTEVVLTLEITTNLINSTIEKIYVTESMVKKVLASMKNVTNCYLHDDMPLSNDVEILTDLDPPVSTVLNVVRYISIIFIVAVFMIFLGKACN